MPKRVHYGGKVHTFPDNATDSQIRKALGVPEPKEALLKRQGEIAAGAPGTGETVAREFLQGTRGAVGLPEENTILSDLGSGLSQMARHPIDSAKMLGGALVEGQMEQGRRAGAAWQAKDPYSLAVHTAGFVVPGLGPAAVGAGEEIGQGFQAGDPAQISHGFGRAAGTLAGLGLGTKTGQRMVTRAATGTASGLVRAGEGTVAAVKKGATATRSLVDPTMLTADDAFIRGVKPKFSTSDVRAKVNTALPEIRRVADEAGIDFAAVPDEQLHGVADQLAQQAGREKWATEIGPRLQSQGIVSASGDPVAAALRAKLRGMSEIALRENKGAVSKLRQKIADYAGERISVAEMETRIQELNNKLRTKQGKLKVDENLLRRDPHFAGDFAELDTLRRLQDDVLSQGGASVRELKKEWGAIREVQGMIERNMNVAERASAQPLFSGLGRMAGAGNVVGGGVQVARGVLTGSGDAVSGGFGNIARGGAQLAVGRKAALMNDRIFLLRQALTKTVPATKRAPFVPPAPRGLLPPGPVEVGPSTMQSPLSSPPPVEATTRAQRLGLLLTEGEKPPIITPPPGYGGELLYRDWKEILKMPPKEAAKYKPKKKKVK